MLATRCLLISLLLLLTGCRNSGPTSRGGVILGLYSHGVKDAIPGLHEFSVVGGEQNGELVYVAWFDRSSATSATTGPTRYEARTIQDNGHALKLVCSTEDGKTGSVSIGGKDYQLAGGAFFMISTRGDSIRVRQSQRDLTKIPKAGGQVLHDFATADPEIKEFFEGKASDKKP